MNIEVVTEKLMTPEGRRALGKYRAGWITLVKGGHMADTALHEAVHAAVDLFLSPEDKAALLADVNGDEEVLAENFVQYAKDRSGFTARVKRIAHRLLRVLRALVGRPNPPLDRVTAFYDDLLAGVFANKSAQESSGEVRYASASDGGMDRKDAEYLKAVEAGDMETAQRLVDEAAKNAGVVLDKNGKPLVLYHGTNADFTSFDPAYFEREDNISLTPRKELAETYLSRELSFDKVMNAWENAPDHIQQEMLEGEFSSFDEDWVKGDLDNYVEQANEDDPALWAQSLTPLGDPYSLMDIAGNGRLLKVYAILNGAPVYRGLGRGKGVELAKAGDESLGYIEKNVMDVNRPGIGEVFADVYHVNNPSSVKSAEPVTHDLAGNVIPLSKRFDLDNTDTRYRTEEQAKQSGKMRQRVADKLQKSENDVIERVGLFLDTKLKDSNARPELSWWQPIVQTISHYKDQVPQIGKLFDSASRLSDNKHLRGEEIFGEGEKDMGALSQFEKRDSAAAQKVKDYLMQRDVDAVGYTVRQNEEGGFDVMNPAGKYVTTGSSEDAAWGIAFAKEAQDFQKAGHSKEAAEAIRTYRVIGHKMYKQLLGSVMELKKQLEEIGAEMPTLEDGTSLFQALKQMGDRRGHYMPRMRKSGQYGLTAKKSGEHPIRKYFVTKGQRQAEAAKLRQQGYTVDFQLNERPAEDVYLDLNMMAMNDVLNNAMTRLGEMDQNVSLSNFGLNTKVVKYQTKHDGVETHLIINTTDPQSFWSELFKTYGGRRYDDGQTGTGEAWHFVNPPKGFKSELAQAMFAHEYGTRQPAIEFGNMLTKQVAEIIHSRGSRSRKIGRNEAKGKDVWKGYEEDAFRAMSLAGKSTAGGTAKRQMAKEMMRIVTGTEKSWADFREEYLKAHPEIDDKDWIQMKTVLKKYQDFVKEQRLDSATQPVAFKEANSFMREMLRNEEPAERVVGAIKGVAALKHLSGIAPGVVNMTALLTTVPSAMSHFGNISLKRSPQLLKRGMANYVRHYTHSRWGKGEGVQGEEDQWLFNEISRRGWDEALMNDEAMKSLQSGFQRSWSNVLEKSLIVFSTTERINRGSTIAAAYYGLMEKNPDMSRDDALKQAKEISDKGHGVYGKVNLPKWARGSAVGAQVGRAWYMYKTFSHNYLQVTGEMIRQGDAKSAAFMLVSPAIIGGAGASILTPAVGALVQGVFSALGLQPPDDPEEEFYLWAADTFGAPAGRFARTGVAGLAGINLKGSLALDVTDLLPTQTSDLLGAPYSLFEDAAKGAASIARGDVVKGVETWLPRFAASPVRAAREATEGVTSKNNQPLYYGDERVKADWYDALLRSLSFNPAGISIKREEQWNERVVENKYRDARTDLYARIRRFMLNGGGTKAEWANILLDAEKYNARVRASRFESIPFITESAIKSQLRKMNTPLKREKIRVGLTEREDPGAIDIDPLEKKSGRRSSRRSARRSL